MREVTPGDADRYKVHLIGKKLAPMTVHKRLHFAAMIFRATLRRRLIAENPFADVEIKASMPNHERFITADETTKLLDACPNHHWKAIIALARYGGLRCPSEVLSLRWQIIDWHAGRIVVQSPEDGAPLRKRMPRDSTIPRTAADPSRRLRPCTGRCGIRGR